MIKKLATLIPALSILLIANAKAERVRWEIAAGGNGHWYEALTGTLIAPGVPRRVPWSVASTDAQQRGGYLATITSADENDFVFGLVDSPIFWTSLDGVQYGPWLGGVQAPFTADPAANWSWVTGEPFQYTNWLANEPNDFANRIEDRLILLGISSRSPYWNDEIQNSRSISSYVVEYVPEPEAIALMAIAAGFLIRVKGAEYMRRG